MSDDPEQHPPQWRNAITNAARTLCGLAVRAVGTLSSEKVASFSLPNSASSSRAPICRFHLDVPDGRAMSREFPD